MLEIKGWKLMFIILIKNFRRKVKKLD